MSNITLDDLARMTANGFSDMNKKIDKRFDKLTKENTADHALIRSEIASIHDDISLIWRELKAMNKKLDELSKRTFEDDELAFKEIMAMKKRLNFLEKEVEKMKLSH